MARSPKSPEEILSRAMSRTLRHKAAEQGIPQDQNGWCKIQDMLAKAPFTNIEGGITADKIYAVVASDKKGRYELNEDKSAVRAVQGHTVNVDVELTPILSEADLPKILVHGTNKRAWLSIKEQGLNSMSRLHIHMASGLPGDSGVISGMRSSATVYIYLDGAKLLKDNIPLLRAANGAYLSPGVDGVISPMYFAKVTDNAGKEL